MRSLHPESRSVCRALLLASAFWLTHQSLGASDYVVTYIGGHLTCTDTSGNGDSLQLVESSWDGGNVRFFASGRTFSVNGGANTTNQTDSFAMADLNSVTMDSGAGNDSVSIQTNIPSNTLSLPSLTINGGTGNDTIQFVNSVTFKPGASLSVDLQNDDVSPGDDRITVATNASLLLSGAGGVVFKASRNISFSSGSVLETADGGILAEANQQAVPTAGNFSGIGLTNARVQATGTGSVTLRGRSGNGGAFNLGLDLRSGTQVLAGASGISIEGRGQNGHSNSGNFGVSVGAGNTVAVVKAVGGDISITGVGGSSGTGSNNLGVVVEGAGEVEATGAGKVTLHGTGGNTTGTGSTNYGIWISGAATRVTTADGKLTLTGIGGGGAGSNNNHGVFLATALLCAVTGTEDVQITGTPGGAGGGSGVVVSSTAFISSAGGEITLAGTAAPQGGDGVSLSSALNAHGGDISLTGVGAGTNNSRDGIEASQPTITSGTGTITMHGSASPDGHGHGVFLSGSNAAVTTSGGSISLTGVGGGGGTITHSFGVGVIGATVSGPGVGAALMIHGTGGASPQNNPYGVEVSGGARLLTSGGDIVLTGTGGANSSFSSYGVQLWSSQISAGGAGNITLTGTGGVAEGSSQHGFFFIGGAITTNDGSIQITGTAGGQNGTLGGRGIHKSGSGTITVGGDHDLTLVADSMGLGVSNSIIATGNDVVILQKTTGTGVSLGAQDTVAGSPLVLGLTDTELDTFVADEVRVGNANTGTVSVAGNISPLSYPVLRLGKGVTFASTGGFSPDISSESDFERMIVNGNITLEGGSIIGTMLGGFVPSATAVIPVIQGIGGVAGNFTSLPEGTPMNPPGLSRRMRLTYAAGGGNHIALYSAPVGVLLGNSVAIAKGDDVPSATDHSDFGETYTMGTHTIMRTFTVLNDGLAPLTGIACAVTTGSPSGVFSLTSSPVAALASGESSTFDVAFDPLADGIQASTVTVTSDQALDSPYHFSIHGTGEIYMAQEQFDDAMTEAGLIGSEALPTATPRLDGVSNLLKHAFNLDLTAPDVRTLTPGSGIAGLPVITFPGPGEMRVEYLRRIGSGLLYTPQKSPSLATGSWAELTALAVQTPIDANWERVHHDEPFNPTTTAVMFGRVRVTIP